jgi:hypothetical protein
LIDFLRITNTYYSNLIEDHNTHPLDIERAMVQQDDEDPAKRDLQRNPNFRLRPLRIIQSCGSFKKDLSFGKSLR